MRLRHARPGLRVFADRQNALAWLLDASAGPDMRAA